jgi:hypothetical protein
MSIKSILEQYEKNSEGSNYISSEERLKLYFTTHLKPNEKSGIRKIRILPDPDGGSPFKEVYGHTIQKSDGKWQTFICPNKMDKKPCPFCELNKKLLDRGDEISKELAKKYYAKKMYVVKVIDRDNEEDGPKFWRFKHSFSKTGVFDKIYAILKSIENTSAPDIDDPENGRDLIITINRNHNNIPTIASIIHSEPSKLSDNEELVKEWLNDSMTWKDVYSIKEYDYLKIIAAGGVPYRIETEDGGYKWVDKETLDDDSGNNDNTTSSEKDIDDINNLDTSGVKDDVKDSSSKENTNGDNKFKDALFSEEDFDDDDNDEIPF